MNWFLIAIQIIIALGIYNVWLLRYGKSSAFRGGDADNMEEEFAAYGLPPWSVKVVGALKLLFATLLLIGIWYPVLVLPAALGMTVLMLGAVAMHIKVKDPLKKSLPAATLLVLSLILVVAYA